MQEQQEWRRKREEESLKNSVLDSTAAARFSTAAALEAAKEKGIAGRAGRWELLSGAFRVALLSGAFRVALLLGTLQRHVSETAADLHMQPNIGASTPPVHIGQAGHTCSWVGCDCAHQ